MAAPLRLVVLCDQAYGPSAGPMGYNGAWRAELAVQLPDEAIVKLGTELFDISIADYSSNSRSWCSVELRADGSGWLVKVISRSMEMGAGEWADPPQRWLGSADGRTWRKLDAAEPLTEGELVDALETPATDRTIRSR